MDLSWIFESIVNWVASIVTSIMDAVSGIFLNALGTDMTAMEQYFPFVTEAFSIFQYTAWALLFLITVWQLFRVFGGPVTEAENPWQLLVRSAIFAILIGYAKPIFLLALDIARAPYTALMDATMDPGSFTFAGVEQVLTNGLSTMVSTITVVGPLLTIILMISLGWNYFKMLLECVERYVVVGVLCYTSPLAFSMGGSKTTNNVFKGWTRMVGSQLLLLVLNVWFLRAFNSTVGQFIGNGGALSTGQGSIFLWMFVALAFLKTAQKFDSYLAAMGLNVAQTGSSMGMDTSMWSKYFRHPRTRRRLNSRCVFMDGAAFNPSQMIFIITVFRVIFSSRLLQSAFNALTTGKISVTSASYITMAWGISRQLSVVMLDTILRAMPKCSSFISAIGSPFAWILCG